MTRRQNPHYRRQSRGDRPLLRADTDRLTYSLLPNQVCHPWVTPILDDLSPDEKTVFQTLIAIERAGYPGMVLPDRESCALARRITGRKCQLSTWRNGRTKLCKRGIARKSWFTFPDQHIRNGHSNVVVPGGARVHLGDDKYCTRKVRNTGLTRWGVGLFDKATRLESAEVLSHLPTALKNTDSPRIEDRVGLSKERPHPCLKATAKDDVAKQRQSKSLLDSEPSTQINTPPITSPDLEGKPTCPSSSPNCSTVEHSPSTADTASTVSQTSSEQPTGEASNKASGFGRGSSWHGKRGCSAERPKTPRGAQNRRGRAYARARLLNILHQCLWNYPTPEADEIFGKARVELELTDFSNWPSVANIPYWLARAPKLTRRELLGYMRARLIPAWKYSSPVMPEERPRYREWNEPARTVVSRTCPAGDLPDFLKNFSRSQGLEQD